MFRVFFVGLLVVTLSACSTMNSHLAEKTKHVEYYRIFDLKTQADRTDVVDAASKGLAKNAGSADETMPIPNFSMKPVTPGRFKVVNQMDQFQGTSLGALAALANNGGSLGMKTAQCDDAIWIAHARKTVNDSFNINLTSCLFEYVDGYHLDMYAHLNKEEGGFMQISRAMANAMVGTPEEWVEKTFLDVVRTINEETVTEIDYIEGYPKMKGTPWLDGGEVFAGK